MSLTWYGLGFVTVAERRLGSGFTVVLTLHLQIGMTENRTGVAWIQAKRHVHDCYATRGSGLTLAAQIPTSTFAKVRLSYKENLLKGTQSNAEIVVKILKESNLSI